MNNSNLLDLYNYLASLAEVEVQNFLFENNFHLLVFLILSSRALEETAYKLSCALIKEFVTPESLSNASLDKIEQCIKPIGFYKIKAERLSVFSRLFKYLNKCDSISSYEDLISIPGIGQKGAKKFLSLTTEKEKFFLIDTHLSRVLTRLGFSTKYISAIESKLASDLGISRVTHFSNLISNFGKYLCLSRKPKCSECNLVRICQFRFIER